MVHHLYNVLFSEKYNLSTLHIQNLVYCLIMEYTDTTFMLDPKVFKLAMPAMYM